VSTSVSLGQLCNTTSPLHRIVAANIGKALFLAPCTSIQPLSLLQPSITYSAKLYTLFAKIKPMGYIQDAQLVAYLFLTTRLSVTLYVRKPVLVIIFIIFYAG
jgi:hypothetical protein